jgi:transposase
MGDKESYPLVVLPPEQGSLVPVSAELVVDLDSPDHPQPDPRAVVAFLWERFCKLATLFFLLLALLHRLRLQIIELRQQANFWQAQHQRAIQREADLKQQIHYLQGEIRELKRRLYGRRSETSSSTKPPANPNATDPADNTTPRKRGQQRGSVGHGRRNHDHLETNHENYALPADEQCCPDCGAPFEEIPGSADGDILEIEVRAHRRRCHRQRYRRTCSCPGQPAVITAPPPDKLIAKSIIGISLWVMILQHKFEFFQPLHRIIAELRSHDLQLPAGTITGGLQKIEPLFKPLYELLAERNRAAEHWHCDETRWRVFVPRADKAGFVWYLWVFATKESIVFVLDPTRAHDVPETHFGPKAEGILNVDRYSAYKAMAQVKAQKLILAFCWAHVRRDFLVVLTGWPELTDWAWSWIEDIGLLYQLNDQRLSLIDDAVQQGTLNKDMLPEGTLSKDTLQQDVPGYAEADRLVREKVEQMRQRCDHELSQPKLRLPQEKTLTSLQEHWAGLTVFVEHPEVPMDNNEAERRQRGPVVARKNFYGSAALWSGRLAAMLFSLFQTLQVWGMDTGKWLTSYLSACAKAGGKPPPDSHEYLPWNMTPQRRESLSVAKPKPPDPPPPDAHPHAAPPPVSEK